MMHQETVTRAYIETNMKRIIVYVLYNVTAKIQHRVNSQVVSF